MTFACNRTGKENPITKSEDTVIVSPGSNEEIVSLRGPDKIIPPELKIEGILPKPYRIRELATKIRQVLNTKDHK